MASKKGDGETRTMRVAPRPEPDARAEIRINEELPRMVKSAIEALGKIDGVYRRGNSLVHVVRDTPVPYMDNGKSVVRPGAMVVRALEQATLNVYLSAAAVWLRHDASSNKWLSTTPPVDVLRAVQSDGEWRGLPALRYVTDTPTMRPDGTILQDEGYDAESGIFFAPSTAKFPRVADKPTKAQAAAAAQRLLALFTDFPFASPAGPSAVLASAMSIIARPAIDGPCPLFLIDATTAGTGKSLLCDAVCLIATGQIPPKRSQLGKDEEEVRKTITSVLAGGRSLCVLDNATRLGSPSFDALLTSQIWEDRILGRTGMVRLPAATVWLVNGNNIRFKGDTARRTVHIRLESTEADPENRTGFAIPDLPGHCRRSHPALVVDCLTILRGFVASGGWTAKGTPWGSFESWAALVAGALAWVGLPSPMDARAKEQNEDADEVLPMLTALCDELSTLHPEPFTIRALLSELYGDPEAAPLAAGLGDSLRSILEEIAPPMRVGLAPDAQRLGWWFGTIKARVTTSGRKLVSKRGHAGIARWHVESLESAKPVPPRPPVPDATAKTAGVSKPGRQATEEPHRDGCACDLCTGSEAGQGGWPF